MQAVCEADKGASTAIPVYPSGPGLGPGPSGVPARGFYGWGPVFGQRGRHRKVVAVPTWTRFFSFLFLKGNHITL